MNHEEAGRARLKVLDLVYKAQTSHIGSNFSCIDILAVLMGKIDWGRDKFVLSKGWAAASLYYFLWKNGKITESELDSYCQPGSKFIGLAEPIVPEIAFAGGSMGMGLPAAVGFALAKKLKGEKGKIYCLMSDGELQSGTTWESLMIAAHQKLNLIVIVDMNGWQAMGRTADILNIDLSGGIPGWNLRIIDGHDFHAIASALDYPKDEEGGSYVLGPTMVLARTVKGKGVSFMEDNNLYHYKNLSEEEYLKAKKELEDGRNNQKN